MHDVEEIADEGREREEEGGDQILAVGPRATAKKGKISQLVLIDDDETDDFLEDYDDEDEDIILEAGPAIVMKPPALNSASSSSHPGSSTMD